jgi:transcriptional pleiotropic regulator of transition state genes
MTRRIDALGRIVIPAELRRILEIRVGDLLDIRVDDGHLVLAKVERSCVFCTSSEALSPFRDKLVCVECIERLTGAVAPVDGSAQSPGAGVGAGDGNATASS